MSFSIGEGQGHYVLAHAPVSINAGAVTSDAFKMENYSHASIIVSAGVTGAAATLTLKENTAADGTGATAIAFSYYAEATAGGDTLGARTAATASGVAMTTNNGHFTIIELDASELSDGSEWVTVHLSAPGAAMLVCIGVVLSGARYAEVESPTAIA
jgi:hypothetical protein|tara:strand:- start:414 stop:884 length:471 start_codon:yes stop_codon:yes gene_type:complete